MRLTQTGTGPGKIIGRGRVEFHAQRGRVIQCADVSWDGEAALIPFLPGLAFDESLPNIRAILGKAQTRCTVSGQRGTARMLRSLRSRSWDPFWRVTV
jgi:hypothetical protein